ncbi:xylulose kinase [Burkholderia cenocepacia]|nr:xylulose kinase [Burkholderia cenocepacia]
MRLLGIDLGTGSVKLVTLDADGVERAVASEPYALSSPQPGWAEIAPDTWWQALVRAAARLPADERAQVAAIGFSGQMHGVVLIDAAGQPVRPALLWPDTRAVREADAASWPASGSPVAGLPVAPNPVAPGMAGPLLRWLATHEPAALRARAGPCSRRTGCASRSAAMSRPIRATRAQPRSRRPTARGTTH